MHNTPENINIQIGINYAVMQQLKSLTKQYRLILKIFFLESKIIALF